MPILILIHNNFGGIMETVTVEFKGLSLEVAVETDTDPNTGNFFITERTLPSPTISQTVADWLNDNFGADIDALLNEKFKY